MGATYREFKVVIQLGNSAMSTDDDIANALDAVANKLRHGPNGSESGVIRDANGNIVGVFGMANAPLHKGSKLKREHGN